MPEVREFEERRVSRSRRRILSAAAGLFLVAGLFAGLVLQYTAAGILLFALGAILFALRGYLNTGDKAVAGALIFVALVAVGIQAVVYYLGP
jgi:hypothetical protein